MANFEIGPERGLARKVENHIKKQKSKQYIIDIIERNSISEIIFRLTSNG
jgi:putative endonuclease